jgi:hypothetical protein
MDGFVVLLQSLPLGAQSVRALLILFGQDGCPFSSCKIIFHCIRIGHFIISRCHLHRLLPPLEFDIISYRTTLLTNVLVQVVYPITTYTNQRLLHFQVPTPK